MFAIKSKSDIEKMAQGGKKLAAVKTKLMKNVKEGSSAWDIEVLANELIQKEGGKSSFKMVANYSWATCINVNEGLVHGIPKREVIFKKGDVVSVDVGMYYRGFHTDTSFSIGISPTEATSNFLEVGKLALKKAIAKTQAGQRIFDISKVVQDALVTHDLTPIRALVGHGIGRDLHEEPQIPCFVAQSREKTTKIVSGMVLAIEVMYSQGTPDVVKSADGWTISMADGKISALFEETVAVTEAGPLVLTT